MGALKQAPRAAISQHALHAWLLLLPALVLLIAFTHWPALATLIDSFFSTPRGSRPGVALGLGCALGCLNLTLLAALGVSALIAASPFWFNLLRWLGGAYLLWLGWQALRSSGVALMRPLADAEARPWQLFRRGLLANALNPKVVLFFLAFLPQFVTPGPWVSYQIVQLGLLFTLQGALIFSLIGASAGRLGASLQRHPRWALWLDRLTGLLFIGLGLRLLVA